MDCDFTLTTRIEKRHLQKKSQRLLVPKTELAALNFSFLPNHAQADEFAKWFLKEGKVIIIAFTQDNFSVSSSALMYEEDVKAVLFLDLQLQHPELWLCAKSEIVLSNLFGAELQVFLMSCAQHNISIHLRAHIDYKFFEDYFLTEGSDLNG